MRFRRYGRCNRTSYLCHFNKVYISRANDENVLKMAKIGYLKLKFYEANDISPCRE